LISHSDPLRSKKVQALFARIAGHYDLMNRIMTGGADLPLRRKAIRISGIQSTDSVLDLGAGTGDMTRKLLKRFPGLDITAADLTFEMLRNSRGWHGARVCAADALFLPFASDTYDAVISGFLVRNVTSLDQALKEQYRVLKPGGKITILDTTQPRNNLMSPIRTFYLRKVIPFLGTLITRDKAAYTYLPESTEQFITAEALSDRLRATGFISINFTILFFGTIAIHTAAKP
jgi:demethylmenaquinone methyltransferase / 2-methoxy-6-polyprenyl-1,4-benzoquinol methylase